MTYGVDQCRRCGKRMKVIEPDAMARYQESLGRKPLMTPKQFKAAGWKASPTFHQTVNPLTGICYDCKPIIMRTRKNMRLDRMLGGLLGLVLAVLLLMFIIGQTT